MEANENIVALDRSADKMIKRLIELGQLQCYKCGEWKHETSKFNLEKNYCDECDREASEPKLLGCPFCGSTAEHFFDEDRGYRYYCLNSGCGCNVDGHIEESTALEAWNRRTQ